MSCKAVNSERSAHDYFLYVTTLREELVDLFLRMIGCPALHRRSPQKAPEGVLSSEEGQVANVDRASNLDGLHLIAGAKELKETFPSLANFAC